MKKYFLICFLLLIIIFFTFVALKELGEKYIINNINNMDGGKNYNFIK